MFMGTWTELTKQQERKTGVSMSAAGPELPPAYLDTLLEATKETQQQILASLRASMVTHAILAAFLFLVVVKPVHNPVTVNGRNSVAVDLSALFAGVAFILSLGMVGVYAHLSSLLPLASTPRQFYWFICSWERALSGGQLATASIISLAFAAVLAAVFELFADWVFTIILFTAATLLYAYLYFWADSMWCPYNGTYVHLSQTFHRNFLDREALQSNPTCCGFWNLDPTLTLDAHGSLYDTMDSYLWGESQASAWCAGSTGGRGLAGGDSVSAGSQLYSARGKSSPLPTTTAGPAPGSSSPARPRPAAGSSGPAAAAGAAGGAAAAAGAAAAGAAAQGSGKVAVEPSLYSGWPSLMRYTSSSNTKLQGRSRRGSGSGQNGGSEGAGSAGASSRNASAKLPA
jgi:hypothetical protein